MRRRRATFGGIMDNDRRCDLIDREIEGTLTEAERVELEELQDQMLAERRRVAPLPLKALRALLKALTKALPKVSV